MKTFEDKLDKILEIPASSIIKKPPDEKSLQLRHVSNLDWKKSCGLETLRRKEIGDFPENM